MLISDEDCVKILDIKDINSLVDYEIGRRHTNTHTGCKHVSRKNPTIFCVNSTDT